MKKMKKITHQRKRKCRSYHQPSATSVGPQQKPTGDKERPLATKEEEIIHWMSQHPALYNAATFSWKGRNTKHEIINMKADEMGCCMGS